MLKESMVPRSVLVIEDEEDIRELVSYNLRKKLGRAGEYIETVRGVGYRFKE